jgi:hypothetical protein
LYKWLNITFISRTKGARELCSHAMCYIQGYKLSSYLFSLTYPLKIIKGQPLPHPTTPRSSPCRCLTQRRAQQPLWVWVAPNAATPEPIAQVRQSPLSSPRAQGPAACWHARGVQVRGCAHPPAHEMHLAVDECSVMHAQPR